MPETDCDVVVVGASAGGVEALRAFAHALPADFPVPVLVVLHTSPTGGAYLAGILRRAGPLPAVYPEDGDVLQAGTIYVAPPDCQMRVHSERVELTKGPRENGHRPAIDPLFRSAARTHDSHAAGVVLSGTLDDGTAGLFDIKQAGGATLVQDPDEALFPGMPLNAIEYVEPDYIQPIEDLVDTLVRLTATGRVARRKEGVMDEPAPDPSAEDAQPGELAPFSCPDCGGTLWETRNGDVTSYRCRVGHAFSISALAAKNADAVEHALWVAYRALEEKAAVSRRVARRLTGADRHASATRFERQADVAARQAGVLKTVLDELQPAIDPVEAAAQASG